MSVRQLIRFAVVALIVIVLVTAGFYVLIYLYRWEWNRAIVSGIFFLAALVTISTLLILRSLRRLEERIDRIARARARSQIVIAEESDRRAARHFKWLREPPRDLQVFIPVLLGAGVLLSVAAYVLERVAGMIAGPTLDRRTAHLVAPDLPLGDDSAATRATPGDAAQSSMWWSLVRLMVIVVVATAAIAVAVDAIGDATQSRPEVPASQGTITIELEIAQRGQVRPPADVAATLWVACRSHVPAEVGIVAAETTGPDSARLTLDHRLGDLHVRRFTGCLEDLTLTSVLADVERIEMRSDGA
ncbi:MAG: hypothetical protein OEU32_09470 [Acidimicrobiia bacterium]|nr:hypothetical protein [Acidimicrobiia bacterium]